MNTLAERLQFLLKEKGITQYKLAETIGISQQAVAKILNGSTKEPKKIYEIANALNVDLEWLKTGSGSSPELSALISPVAYEPDNNHAHCIEQLDVQAVASNNGIENADFPDVIQKLYLSDDGVLQLIGRKSAKGIKLITIPTDSMTPTIHPSDIVFIDTLANSFTADGVYLFRLNNRLFLKRLQLLPTGELQASSDNRNYSPFVISEETFNSAEIVGKFVRVLKIEKIDL